MVNPQVIQYQSIDTELPEDQQWNSIVSFYSIFFYL